MKRPVRWCLLLAVLASAAVAPLAARAALPAAASHDLVLLQGGTGAKAAIFTLRVGNNRVGSRVPLGLLAPNGRTLYAATAVSGHRTMLRAIDTSTGRTLRSLVLHCRPARCVLARTAGAVRS